MIHSNGGRIIVDLSNQTMKFLLLILLTISLVSVATVVSLRQQPVQPALAVGPIRIMPLGDSITYGVGSPTKGGYRTALWNDCQSWKISYVGSQVSGPYSLKMRAHEGHPGWRIDQVSDHVVGWLQTYRPQIILLHIGTNDILQNYDLPNAPRRLQMLLDRITATLPDTTVIVAQIIPVNRPNKDTLVVQYNLALTSVVRSMVAQGKHLLSVDMYHAVPLNTLPDGIHPDNYGYSLMAPVWYRALQPILDKRGSLHSWLRS